MWGWQGWHGDDRDDMGKTGKTASIDPPINPPFHPTTHEPRARGVSANHKSSNRIELSWLSQDLFDFLWFDMAPPINPPKYPPTHQIIHPPIGGGDSTDFKSSNKIKISWFVQALLNFYWFWWSPSGGGGGGWGLNGDLGMMWGWQGWCEDDRDDMGTTGMTWGRQGRHHYHDKHVGSHLQFFMCVCVHACMCTCVGTPPSPHHSPAPLPRAAGSPKHQNSISPELIEIIRFCLKILYLWTFLNCYRL